MVSCMNTIDADVLVTGGTGFIGRWLLAALTARGRRVVAPIRGAKGREAELRAFVARIGGDPTKLVVVEGDVEREGMGLAVRLAGLRDVYHLAARFAFGMKADEARRANVDGSLAVARWALEQPGLRRLVFLGGYRMTRPGPELALSGEPGAPGVYPLAPRALARLYRAHGAYEASKHESYLAMKDLARARPGLVTFVHPSGVIGDSRTGETTQLVGLGETVKRLWDGQLPALVGTERTFVPLVTVDYLAAFLATVPEREETRDQDLVVLDPETPRLPDLVRGLAAHLGVRAPRRTLPAGLVRALPRALTGVEPESLGFLVEDTYDTRAADEHAAQVGLARPSTLDAAARWCDFLVSTRFLEEPGADRGALRQGVFTVGEPATADVAYLHGLPWNGDAWRDVAARVPGEHVRIDLPGLGRSASSDDPAWLERVLLPRARGRRIVLVGHSLGAAAALRFAHAHPDAVAGLVLVSPAFLQRPAPRAMRIAPLVSLVLRRSTAEGLASRLGVGASGGARLATRSAVADLRRAGVAGRVARALVEASRARARGELARLLAELTVPCAIVHGSGDPLTAPVPAPVRAHVVAGAGHDPMITHAGEVAAVVRSLTRAGDASDRPRNLEAPAMA